ncbi:MAG TPA: hypothetical protein PLE19_01715 [Planctomycetota bacterium]|nr:hypothetical protein [Planctomycetota bacterium]HRR82789.1 hypothetical protein [Planctomycetota bacterium]HRT93826.1 hypothetical protein [Planctomycetota bacterium]
MTTRCSWLLVAALASSCGAAQLVCEGILGNSGEQGETLVRFATARPARGMGVAVDRFGSLWDRAGAGRLNRYAPDGRLLAHYRIPDHTGSNDQIALVGDTVVLLLGDQLYALPITAAPGSEAASLGLQAQCISFGAHQGRIAAATKADILLVDPATRDARKLAAFPGVQALDFAPDGALLVMADWRVHKLADGKPVSDGWPKGSPGERMQCLDGGVFGHAWHGTIRRFTADLEPAPGVVLGGASGSFIGHLDQNSELSNGRGMALVRPGLFAVSGLGGILHLMAWDAERQQMTLVRRIGAVPACRGIGLDREGNVWWHAGSWKWADRPDTPLRFGVNAPEHPGVAQVAMLDSDSMVAPGNLWGKPAFYYGPLTREVQGQRVEQGCGLKNDRVGCAVYKSKGALTLLATNEAGEGQAFAIGADGRYERDLGAVALKAAAPVKAWTSLAMKGPDTLLGAADGHVVEMARDGNDWKETRRWRADFGPAVWIAADSGKLWVADRDRHRVVVLDLATEKALASFGTPDKAGADLASLAGPTVIAARGERAVVYDAGNQRLVKLALPRAQLTGKAPHAIMAVASGASDHWLFRRP